MEPEEQQTEQQTVKVNLVGVKRMKSQHCWRLELDIYEVDSAKVKTLVDNIEQDFYMILVPIEQEE